MKPDTKLRIREKLFKWIFLTGDAFKIIINRICRLCRFFFIITLILFIIGFIYYIGFSVSDETIDMLRAAFRVSFLILFITKYIPAAATFKKNRILPLIFTLLLFIFTLGVLIANFLSSRGDTSALWRSFYGTVPVIIAVFLIGLSEMSGLARLMSTVKIPPALIFSFSFILIIIIGSGLLILPNAHNSSLSYIDSLFTSVSAVCVTGLIVVDTSSDFTILGQVILLCLIQIGGLGIMTFTGFFSHIFSSGSSFRDKLLLKEIFSSESLNNLFKLLAKILLITFLTEITGALLIYSSLDWRVTDKIFFSVFHSVSGFCNAGFSTLPEGLYSSSVRYNSPVFIYIAVLVILGGIGFPVLLNLYSYFKRLIVVLIQKIRNKIVPIEPVKRNMSTRIVLFTTVILLLAGAAIYFLFESDKSLKDMSDSQKIITSFFGSVSARTAGFNIVDITQWSYPTVFLVILLMWVGASPGSTGGGIKTTTFALALRSAWTNIRGREQMVIGNREIGNIVMVRVLSIIILSMIAITAGFFGLLITEPAKNPVSLIFDSFSAFSTVGLSIANTATFSKAGKIIMMLLMFIGRVGPLTLLTGFMLSHHRKYSRYPETDILIN
ncbi:MAG: potassium transporter TrkG [Bacteroidota bacterium]